MSIKIAMLEQELESVKAAAYLQKSLLNNLLIDIQVALEEYDVDEAILMIKEHFGEVRT